MISQAVLRYEPMRASRVLSSALLVATCFAIAHASTTSTTTKLALDFGSVDISLPGAGAPNTTLPAMPGSGGDVPAVNPKPVVKLLYRWNITSVDLEVTGLKESNFVAEAFTMAMSRSLPNYAVRNATATDTNKGARLRFAVTELVDGKAVKELLGTKSELDAKTAELNKVLTSKMIADALSSLGVKIETEKLTIYRGNPLTSATTLVQPKVVFEGNTTSSTARNFPGMVAFLSVTAAGALLL